MAGLGLAIGAPSLAETSSANSAADVGAANGGLEEIIVTARRKEENIQIVPVAVTVVSQQDIGDRGTFDISDLGQDVPNLNFSTQAGSRSDILISLRGQSNVFGGRFPSTVPYFAEVPVFLMTNGQFYDLDNVQVLRGPQGTLFGRVTDGGNIMLTPQKPSNDFEGYIDAKGGNYALHDVKGAVNLPLIDDKLLFRAAFDVNRRDGYTTNILTGNKLDDVHYESFRASVVYKPIDGLENYTIYAYNDAHENGSSNAISYVNPAAVAGSVAGTASLFGFPPGAAAALGASAAAGTSAALAAQQAMGPRSVNIGSLFYGSNGGIFNDRHDTYVINTTTWRQSDDFQIKNILGYIRVNNHWGSDFDGSPVPIIDEPNPVDSYYDFNYAQYSEEFQVQGRALGGKLEYTAGTYWDYMYTPRPAEFDTINLLIINNDTTQYETTRSQAVYTQFRYDLGDILTGLKVDAGVRYTLDLTESDDATQIAPWDPTGSLFGLGPLGFDTVKHGVCDQSVDCTHYDARSHALTYTFGLDYQVADRALVYGKLSRGYRPGGFNATSGTADASYTPEYDLSLEFGAKVDYDISSVHARTNVALFRDRYSDIQKLEVLPSIPPTSLITNAANADVMGVELEQTIVPVKGLTIKADWGYIDARYDRQSPAQLAQACYYPYVGFCTLNQFQATPKNTISADVSYTLPLQKDIGEVAFGGNWYHRTMMYGSDSSFLDPTLAIPGYSLFNLNASWTRIVNSPVDLYFFMTNVANKVYVAGSGSFQHTIGISTVQYGEPRMWGFGVRYNFGRRN